MTKRQRKNLWRIIIAAIWVGVALFLPLEGFIKLGVFLIPYGIIGYDILKKAVAGILNKQIFDENFLMAVATVGAILLGEYVEATAVMLFYQVGELFQSVAVGKSRKNIAALMDIRPDYANVELEDGSLERCDPEEISVGTVIVVLPGERIPIDGMVVEGEAVLNTSALTGESVPRDVKAGDAVISGCINMSGRLRVSTTKDFGESTVSKILELVENSGMHKAKTEKFITRFAQYYTPVVCLAALLLAVVPPLLQIFIWKGIGEWGVWIIRALTFLVISCPCALVISIPLSFFGGIGGASAQGILIKGSNYLEALAKTECVVFDKTGTLTKGVFQVIDVIPADGVNRQELLRIATYGEFYSNHPISKSLKEAFEKEIENIDTNRIEKYEELSGYGIKAIVDGHEVVVGNGKLMEQENISCHSMESAGTIVHVASDNSYMGCILIADVIKEETAEALKQLRKSGVKKLVMLTGDAKKVADEVAKQLGMDITFSELLPGEKVEKLEELLQQKKTGSSLVFVGDGINDAPVLTRADIGIAMGAMGADAAIEAADIVLMDDNPMKIAQAIQISRKCLRIVYENIVFALGVKVVCLILGAIGIANMWLAIFADVGVMVLAVLNAIRCLKRKE